MCLLQNQPGQGVWPVTDVRQPEGGSSPQVHGEGRTRINHCSLECGLICSIRDRLRILDDDVIFFLINYLFIFT